MKKQPITKEGHSNSLESHSSRHFTELQESMSQLLKQNIKVAQTFAQYKYAYAKS